MFLEVFEKQFGLLAFFIKFGNLKCGNMHCINYTCEFPFLFFTAVSNHSDFLEIVLFRVKHYQKSIYV